MPCSPCSGPTSGTAWRTTTTSEGPAPLVTECDGGGVWDDGGVRITAAPTDHRPVEPTLGYRLDHDDASVVIGGDGVPCAGLDELCAGADAYVQTALREDLVRQLPFPRFLDTIDYHSTVRQAGETAHRAGMGTLVLTHQVPTRCPARTTSGSPSPPRCSTARS